MSGASRGFHETHGFLRSGTGESSPVAGSNQSEARAHIVINAVINVIIMTVRHFHCTFPTSFNLFIFSFIYHLYLFEKQIQIVEKLNLQ